MHPHGSAATRQNNSEARSQRSVSIGLALTQMLLLFQFMPGGEYFAAASLLMFVSLAVWCGVVAGRRLVLGITLFDVTLTCLVFCSSLAFLMSRNDQSAVYTLEFAAVALGVGLIARSCSAIAIVRGFAWAHLAAVFIIVLCDLSGLFVSLSSSSETRWMSRFSPLGIHPNLLGFVTGGGAIFLVYGWVRSTTFLMKGVYFVALALAMAIIVAAGARGGLVALAASGSTMLFLYRRQIFPRIDILGLALSVVGCSLIAINWMPILQSASVLLELDSPTRGWHSGASGRSDIWSASLERLANGSGSLFIGTGLRTIEQSGFGFSNTENSYLNMAIEDGLFCAIAFVLLCAGGMVRLVSRKVVPRNLALSFLGWLLLYACIQSLFNRYLLGIGNTVSIGVLLATAVAWLPRRRTRHVPAQAHPGARGA